MIVRVRLLAFNANEQILRRNYSDAESPSGVPSLALRTGANAHAGQPTTANRSFFIVSLIIFSLGFILGAICYAINGSDPLGRISNDQLEDLREAMTKEIEAKLLYSSWDDIGVTDFARSSSGAYQVLALTSPTYTANKTSPLATIWRFWAGKPYITPRLPSTALSPGNLPGECWSFAGRTGHLGIQLPMPIAVSGMTIDHASNRLTWSVGTAPRIILLWSLVDRDTACTPTLAGKWTPPTPVMPHIPVDKVLAPILEAEYDVGADNNIQTFSVAEPCKELISTNTVVAQFVDNWGSTSYTCIYRVRIHGNPLS